MIEGHYFKIISTIYSFKWNSTSSGCYHATHLVWLQEWHPLQYKGLWLQEIWLWPFGCIQIFCACSGSCASLNLSRYRFQIREHNWWWNFAFEPFHTEFLKLQLRLQNRTFWFQNRYFGLVNKEVLEFCLFEMSDILNFSII
jgi:hypothetical protein